MESWSMCVNCGIIFFSHEVDSLSCCQNPDKITVTLDDIKYLFKVVILWRLDKKIVVTAWFQRWSDVPEELHLCLSGILKTSLET